MQMLLGMALRDEIADARFNDRTPAGPYRFDLRWAQIHSNYLVPFVGEASRSDGPYVAKPEDANGLSHADASVLYLGIVLLNSLFSMTYKLPCSGGVRMSNLENQVGDSQPS